MMNYYRTRKNSQVKLPPFNELVASFSSIHIKSSPVDAKAPMSVPPLQMPYFQPLTQSHMQPVTPANNQPHPDFANYKFPPQNTEQISPPDIDYVLRSEYPIPTDFDGNRRASLQFHPGSYKHQQSDSYDSQTGLSTLADIASSSNREKEHIDLLNELKSSMNCFQKLNQIFAEINTDFKMNLKPSGGTDDNLAFIKSINFKQFLNNIPICALQEAIEISNEISQFFQHWLIQRDREEQQMKRKRSVGSQSQKKSAIHLRPSHRHQDSISSYPYPAPKKENKSKSPTSPTKKRKTSSNSSRSDNISLVVKPPTPTIDASKPVSTNGELREDLSIKIDHTCQQCGSDDTPEWRKGPYGSRSLCNACGLFFGKLTKKFGVEEATKMMIERRDKGDGDDRRIPNE